jgi:hypothetical protein
MWIILHPTKQENKKRDEQKKKKKKGQPKLKETAEKI